MPATSIVHPDDRDRVAEFVRKGRRGEPTPRHYEFKGVRKDGSAIYVEASTSVITYTAGRQDSATSGTSPGAGSPKSRKDLTNTILRTLNSPRDIKTLTRDILHLLKEHVGAESAGVRMRSGDDLPLPRNDRFPARLRGCGEFAPVPVAAGASLATDTGDSPRLSVRERDRGQARTAFPLSLRTAAAFGRTTASSLLSTLGGRSGLSSKGAVHREGYESIALVPLRSGDEMVGILQFAEKRPGLFTREDMEHLEGIGTTIGIALLRKEAEERIRASEENYRDIFENAMEGIFRRTPEGALLSVNPALARIHGYASPEEMMLDVVDTSKKGSSSTMKSARATRRFSKRKGW